MQEKELFVYYVDERKQEPESIHHVLDFYQMKYVAGEIDANEYRKIFYLLHSKGAVSAHEYV
ncbi:YppF family protein [Oceanobacillus halotolerans]|uniref:YppF family protein n=1 Tax=Oceanobacillus halotolerans TaxID=2663380 RepID=UPI0013DB78DF|nr:YppF family protein [Oceanobacillus halotolerans]